MYKVSREVYILLYELYVLACMREPVQGKFDFSKWNVSDGNLQEKENVPNCGTAGCLAGGYLPLIDSRFHFDIDSQFKFTEKNKEGITYTPYFMDSLFFMDNSHLFRVLFTRNNQEQFGYRYNLNMHVLSSTSTHEEVTHNLRKVLTVLTCNAPNMYSVSESEYEERLLEEVCYKGLLQRFNHTDRKPKPMTIEAFREWFKRYTRINIYKDSSEYRTSILNEFVSGTWYDLCKEV